MATSSKTSLSEAIAILTAAGDRPQSETEVKSCVGVVEKAARSEGLLPGVILSLTKYTATRSANSVILSRVVRSLIPRTTVPCSAVLRLLGSLKGQTLSLQLLIIRWVILVYDVIDNRTDLHGIYGILFYYLQVDALRPVICQLLCYLTRRCDMTHYRVQRLTELSKRVDSSRGAEGGLSALLVLYHSYCPHMLPRPQYTRRKVWFRPFEKLLAANIRRVQKEGQPDSTSEDRATIEQLNNRLTGAPPPMKRSRKGRVTVVPRTMSSSSSSSSSSPSGDGGRDGVIAFATVSSHRQLCSNITRIEFPSQVASVLNSHALRHMFAVCTEPSAVVRFTYWLEHTLGYELDSYTPGSINSDLQALLRCLYKLTQFIQEPIPTVESFLSILLEEWNGDDYRHEIMNLLSFLSLRPFDDFEKECLEPIKRHFVSKDREFKTECLHSLSQLLRNMALCEWPRHQKNTSSLHSDSHSPHRESLFSSVFEDDTDDDFNPLVMIRLFIKYVDHLITIALQQEGQHLLIYHAAMAFYGVVADLPGVYGVPHLSLPSPSTLYCGLLGPSPLSISWACSHLIKVKESLSGLSRNERSLQLTQTFNSIVLDFCNALWRNAIFKKNQKSNYPTLAFDLSREQLDKCCVPEPHKRLNLVHHPALTGLVLQFFIETQEVDKLSQLLPSAIWQETRFKQVYLQFLGQNHLPGITDFIKTFVHTN